MKKNIIIISSILILLILIVLLYIPENNKEIKLENNSGVLPSVGGLLNSKDFISLYKENSEAILLDLRTPEEYNESHIEGALNIDFYNSNFEDEISKLDKNKTYFIYCRSGNRSSSSVPLMKKAGINNIYDLKGGIVEGKELLN